MLQNCWFKTRQTSMQKLKMEWRHCSSPRVMVIFFFWHFKISFSLKWIRIDLYQETQILWNCWSIMVRTFMQRTWELHRYIYPQDLVILSYFQKNPFTMEIIGEKKSLACIEVHFIKFASSNVACDKKKYVNSIILVQQTWWNGTSINIWWKFFLRLERVHSLKKLINKCAFDLCSLYEYNKTVDWQRSRCQSKRG